MTPIGRKYVVGMFVAIVVTFLFSQVPRLAAQVGPAEIKNPGLRTLEEKYLPDLVALHQSVSDLRFPFKLSLSRYVGLDPKDQVGADARGFEFVTFHERELLKMTANYNAAFNSSSMTPNQRAGRVLNEVILPVLRLLPDHFSPGDPFDGFGFEIGYHVVTHNKGYEYEGKENLVVVFDRADGLRYASLGADSERQLVLNRSEIYLNGEVFGLALGSNAPFDANALVHRPAKKTPVPSVQPESPPKGGVPAAASASAGPLQQPVAAKTAVPAAPASVPKIDVEALRVRFQSELETLHKEGMAKFQFVDYAPPAFILVRDQAALQATLRNPESFDKEETSIYRRAARTFDLFLATRLKWIVSKVPDFAELGALDISVINELTSGRSAKTSEAIEFILPLQMARQFTAADITNQELIDHSLVLVNGVRIALNLAQVE